ncbi:hypothetical protein F1904_12800 [Akkermansia muciniphila]|nr:hypothetical protein F1904_12800 [Akkermansia muciniphila]
MTAEALKAAFDKSSKAVLMPALNGVIDTLSSAEGASNIGTADGETLEAKAQKADGAAAAAATAAGEAQAAKTAAEAATTVATAASTAASKAAQTAAAAAEAASGATALLKGNKPVIDLVATGNGTAYTAQSERVTALEAGMLFVIRFSAANTGAVTLDVNALGAKPVKQIGTSGAKGDCIAGDFGQEQRYWLQYDGAEFYPVGSSARAAKSGIWVGETEPPADAGYALWVDPSDMSPGELTGFGALNTGDIPKFGGDYLVPAVPGVDIVTPTTIAERGSVAGKGEYLKFADGTLIQWHKEAFSGYTASTAYGSLFYFTVSARTFPIPFAAKPQYVIARINYNW